jgi:hypothetical protein
MPIVRHIPGLYAKRRHPYYIAALATTASPRASG